MGSILQKRVAAPYVDKVLELEQVMLRSRGRTGEISVPLAFVVAEMGTWEGLLMGVGRLLDELEQDAHDWTSARVLSVLQRHSNTGLVELGELLKECIGAVASIWIAGLTEFVIWGRVGRHPLVLVSSNPTTTTTTYTFPDSSLPVLPNLSNPAMRTALLTSLSTICLALSLLRSLPPDSSPHHSSSAKTNAALKAHTVATRNDAKQIVELARPLRLRIQSVLEGCQGPMDEHFSRRISSIEGVFPFPHSSLSPLSNTPLSSRDTELLSTHLLTLHLPLPLLTHTLTSLSSIYFLLAGSFASNLLREIDALRSKTARVLRGKGIGNFELAGVLARAVGGTELDQSEEEPGMRRKGMEMEAFRLVLGEGEEEGASLSTRLLGPELKLVFEPTPALALVFSDEVRNVYQNVWGYLLAVRNCHSRLLST